MFGLLVETFVAVSREAILKNVNLCLKYDMFRWKSRRWKVDLPSTLEDKLFLRIATSDSFSQCIQFSNKYHMSGQKIIGW